MRDNQEMYFVCWRRCQEKNKKRKIFFFRRKTTGNSCAACFWGLSARVIGRPRRKRTQSHHRRSKSFFGFIASFFPHNRFAVLLRRRGRKKKDNERRGFLFFFPGLFARPILPAPSSSFPLARWRLGRCRGEERRRLRWGPRSPPARLVAEEVRTVRTCGGTENLAPAAKGEGPFRGGRKRAREGDRF